MSEHLVFYMIFTLINGYNPVLKRLATEQKIFHTLRIASAMCLIGHGFFGIITKAVWCNYLAVVGVGEEQAYHLMPVIGSIDILLGISLLAYPMRAVTLWLIFWGFLTAVMRPLAGEPFMELLSSILHYLENRYGNVLSSLGDLGVD
jgi:hypothetical protein